MDAIAAALTSARAHYLGYPTSSVDVYERLRPGGRAKDLWNWGTGALRIGHAAQRGPELFYYRDADRAGALMGCLPANGRGDRTLVRLYQATSASTLVATPDAVATAVNELARETGGSPVLVREATSQSPHMNLEFFFTSDAHIEVSIESLTVPVSRGYDGPACAVVLTRSIPADQSTARLKEESRQLLDEIATRAHAEAVRSPPLSGRVRVPSEAPRLSGDQPRLEELLRAALDVLLEGPRLR